MEKIVTVLVAYAQQQVEAGADVIQVFDSWVGKLSVGDYTQYCLALDDGVGAADQGDGRAGDLLWRGDRFPAAGDERDRRGCDRARLAGSAGCGLEGCGRGCAVQGNLDPIALFAPEEVLKERVREVLTRRRDGRGTSSTWDMGLCRGRRWRM